jgi:hypothetical protein
MLEGKIEWSRMVKARHCCIEERAREEENTAQQNITQQTHQKATGQKRRTRCSDHSCKIS